MTARVPLLVAFALAGPASAADDPPAAAVAPAAVPLNVFGGREVEYRFRVNVRRAVKGRLAWTYKVGPATAAARELPLDATPDRPAEVAFKVPVPPVKDGVVLQSRLTVTPADAAGRGLGPAFEADVWVFPADPFAGRSGWLKGLKLAVYDPPGATAKVLAAAGVPFEQVHAAAALADRNDGFLVVGEGVAFKEERGLADALAAAAARGAVVLCLAPAGGDLVIPGIGGPAARLRDVTFARDLPRRLDRRLDPGAWPTRRSLTVQAGEARAVGGIEDGPGGWPWAEARFESGGGRWAVCGLPVAARWDDGPAARFLFARMLEHLSGSTETQPK